MIFSERYKQSDNLWMPDEKYNFQYSDGDENENYIFNAILQSDDLSIGSLDLFAYIKDWPSLYHLSPKRADLLRPLAEQLKGKKILEIGSGCGAITRFLGEMNCEVLALEGSLRRARITLERCRGLDNVKVVADNFDAFVTEEKFDCITLIGVLEYSNLFIKGDNPALAMLTRVKQLLKPDGYIIIGIENKMGLKYWAGAPEDHVSKAYHGIQNLYSNAGPETFGHYEISSLVKQAGFGISEFMYPFPDYKFADVIITDAGFKKQEFDPLELLVEKFDYFQNTRYDSQFSSTLTAHSLFNNNVLPYFANSFLITANLDQAVHSHKENQMLAYVYSTSRKKSYCKQTVFSSNSESESISVTRQLLYEGKSKGPTYVQHVLQDETYINGRILFSDLLPIVSASGWTIEDISKWARTFYDVIISKSSQKDQQAWLAGNYLDLAPFNIIIANCEPRLFDLEWACDEDIPAYYIFFRGIAHSLGRILFVNNPQPGTPLQVMQLATEVTRHYFYFDHAELLDCKTREIKYFSAVALRETTEPFATAQLNVRGSDYLKLLESNKELLLQNEKLLNELREKQEQFSKAISALSDDVSALSHEISAISNDAIKREADLLQEISLLKKNSQWYIDTYVNRSLLGTLKEKIKSGLKKKLILDNDQSGKKTGGHRYSLLPVNDLQKLDDTGQYSSTGTDPFFLVGLENAVLKAGWYWLSMEFKEVKGVVAPRLYYDYGQGFNETDIWNLPNVSNDKIECLVHFPFRIYGLRFDPTITRCTFTINDFNLTPIRRIKALQIAISKYKEINWPRRNQISFYTGLLITFLKSGQASLRKRLRDSVTYSHNEILMEKYREWCTLYDTLSPRQLETVRALAGNLAYQPLFSVIMPVYNAPVKFLKMAIESVRKQAYKNWELCIADDRSTNEAVRKLLKEYQAIDPRIKVIFRSTNGHISIASNSAVAMASGDYIVLLDQDDELPPHCLYMVAKAINENRALELIYSDEDKIDEQGNRFDPYFKSDWNKDLFYGQNLISHLGVYKLSLIKKIGWFREGYEGSQDYDLALRCIEHLAPYQIHHIPHVLYHWRAIEGSTSVNLSNKNYAFDAGLRALKDHLRRTGQSAVAEQNIFNSYRVKWILPGQEPMVSIIIPTKDKVDVLANCVSSVIQKTRYNNFELVIIDNNSEEIATKEYLKNIQNEYKQVKLYPYSSEFNFSAIVNYGVKR